MIRVIEYTKNPLSLMGEVASSCWNSTPSKDIAIKCLNSNHGRVLEYPDATIEISDYSARVMRELYTHVSGVSRLQSSTRYINYGEFSYVIPDSIEQDKEARAIYIDVMFAISKGYQSLQEKGIPKEDTANILPLGMTTKVVLKINLRAILHMFEERTCTRAYYEYRKLMKEMKDVLMSLDGDWKFIIENYAKTKCEKVGFCIENKSCGRAGIKI